MHLTIAYKNYSSWSLRPWLAMKVAGIEFSEALLPFYHDSSLKDFAKQEAVPACVPILQHQGRTIWDSLAIMEYLADTFPDQHFWPDDPGLKAIARSASAEMHSGFMALRSAFPMNCRRSIKVMANAESQRDLTRLAELWQLFTRQEKKPEGKFLCGPFSIVDAMYAPVLWRVKGYGLMVSEEFELWAEAMLALPAMQQWLLDAKAETWVIEQYENYGYKH